MIWDIKILYLLNGLAGKSAVFDRAVIFLANDLPYLLVILALLGLYFWRISRPEKKKIFWVVSLSAAVSRFGVTELIRFFYHRPRPLIAYGGIHALMSDNESSFPSGHATFFFALAAAVYFYNKRWGSWFFIAAILISIGRVIAGIHYPSDILGGAVIGIAVGYAVYYCAGRLFIKKLT